MHFGVKGTKEISNTNFYTDRVNSQAVYWVKT